jgi:hypothetical protein
MIQPPATRIIENPSTPLTPPSQPLPNMGSHTVSKEKEGCLSWCWEQICKIFAAFRALICCSQTNTTKPLPPIQTLPSQPPTGLPSIQPLSIEPPTEPTELPASPPEIPQKEPSQVKEPSVSLHSTTPDLPVPRKMASEFVEGYAVNESGYDYADLTTADVTDKFKEKSNPLKMFILSELTAEDRPTVPQDAIEDYLAIVLETSFLTPQEKQTLNSHQKDRTKLHEAIEAILSQTLYNTPPTLTIEANYPWAEAIIDRNQKDVDIFLAFRNDSFTRYPIIDQLEFLLALMSKKRFDVLDEFLLVSKVPDYRDIIHDHAQLQQHLVTLLQQEKLKHTNAP